MDKKFDSQKNRLTLVKAILILSSGGLHLISVPRPFPPFQRGVNTLRLLTSGGTCVRVHIPWNDVSDTITNLSYLNSPILNENGFVGISEDGHFTYNGERIRFFGGNLGMGANFPTHEESEIAAGRLAKLGCNLVRLTHMDLHFSSYYGEGIWLETDMGDKRHIDPIQLEKLDYLLYQLKSHGIFVNLNLHVSRELTAADGIQSDPNMPVFNKGVDIFDATMIDRHKEYAHKLLCHVNQYSNLAYYDDPVIAMVEVTNEDSLLVVWQGWEHEQSGDIDRLGQFYQDQLNELWWIWWDEHVGGERVPRPTRDQVASGEYSQENAQRYIDFLLSLEENYHEDMVDFLKNLDGPGIGVKVPISGTNVGTLDGVLTSSFHDKHRCWGCWTEDGYFFMDSIAEDPFRSYHDVIPHLSGAKVAGKPYVASEVSSPAPNYHAAEPIILAALYGAFQDWDGIIVFAYRGDHVWNREYIQMKYDFDRHMTKMVAITEAALLFRRADIRMSQMAPLTVVTTRQDVLEEAWGNQNMDFYKVTHALGHSGPPGYLPAYTTLMRRIEIAKGEEHSVSEYPEEPDPHIYETDTRELMWHEPSEDQGFVKVDAYNVQAVIGFIGNHSFQFIRGLLGGGSIRVLQITSTAIIGVILRETTPSSSTYLIVATGEIQNTGQSVQPVEPPPYPNSPYTWYELVRWALDPFHVLVEGIDAYITIPIRANHVEWYALDPQGYRGDAPLPKDDLGTATRLNISPDYQTLWYEVVITQA